MEPACRLKDEWLDPDKSFAFPLWPTVNEWVDRSFATSTHFRVYSELARDWVERIVSRFPVGMTVAESPHFIIAVPAEAKNAQLCLSHLEDYRIQIFEALSGLDLFAWGSKSVVIIAPDTDTFTRYIGDYYQKGEYMMPGGVCLRHGYIHFILPQSNLTHAAPVLAHELCHVCVTGIPWPTWVEEGVVQSVEYKVGRRNPYILDRDIIRQHQKYWTPAAIKDFWSGDSFHYPNEGSRLSYHLARFLLEATAQHGRVHLLRFLRSANRRDSGFAAMHEVVGVFPDEVVGGFLGWKPQVTMGGYRAY